MPGGENRTGGGEESPLRGRSDSVSSSRGLPNQPPVPSPLSSPHDYSRTSRAKSKFVSVPGEGSGVDFLGAEGNISRHNASQHRNSLRSGLFGRDDGSPSKAAELEEFSGSDVESSIGYSSLGSLDDSRMQDFSSPSELEDKDGQMDYKPDALAKSEYTDWVDINSENENFEAQFDSYQDKLNLANEKFQGILDGLLESFKRNFTEAVKGRIPGVTAGRTKLSILGPGKSKKAFKILMKEFDVLDDDDRMAASELNQGWQSSTVGASSGYDMTSQIFKFFKEYGTLFEKEIIPF